ncbi:hypothetical protein BS329_38720 [Amycolatopsis coloradensis]|uniref:SAM-dependent methyltransferase n=1 Tax=Amycolatopsis coloradensis TaxID=76021 RepID=A0A1R0KEK8_9PSEU|nr:SAM-dependent methyltransferase [Amycolatopsis coloradensis]OLZ43593.1 hypothetical protein BS329_38720 [Amycolatopsis coloradensis]
MSRKPHHLSDVDNIVRHLLFGDEITRRNQLITAEVRALALAAGVTQVLHLGCGMPTADGDQNHPAGLGIREVAVDNDPIVVSVRERQRRTEARRRSYRASALPAILEADLRDPGAILASTTVRNTLDLGKPLLLLATAAFHHIPNIQRPGEIVAHYLNALAPGSYIVVSHLALPEDQNGRRRLAAAHGLCPDVTPPAIARPRAVLEGWLRGLDRVPLQTNGGRFLHAVAGRSHLAPTAETTPAPRRGPSHTLIQPASSGSRGESRTS